MREKDIEPAVLQTATLQEVGRSLAICFLADSKLKQMHGIALHETQKIALVGIWSCWFAIVDDGRLTSSEVVATISEQLGLPRRFVAQHMVRSRTCLCGCGERIIGGRSDRKYISAAHRERARYIRSRT